MLSVNHPVPAAPDRSGRATRGVSIEEWLSNLADANSLPHGNVHDFLGFTSRADAMSIDRTELIDFLENLIRRPAMVAGTPEAAHGIAVALFALLRQESAGGSYEGNARETHAIIKRICSDVARAECQGVLLCCDECYPELRTSFPAFTRHASLLFEELIGRPVRKYPP